MIVQFYLRNLMWQEMIVSVEIVTMKCYSTSRRLLQKNWTIKYNSLQNEYFMFNLWMLSWSRFLHTLDRQRDKRYSKKLPQSDQKSCWDDDWTSQFEVACVTFWEYFMLLGIVMYIVMWIRSIFDSRLCCMSFSWVIVKNVSFLCPGI